ncbi:plasmid stabilization system protein ParE [Rhodopseudomonas rhenobacensis]|uniref:Plasmid stabilization system protein ParE n=1 Tax=Rhodopseudomonas rhenobacensis TaxID=87461 RepID=A0A7W7Z454_9BRAD|nr:type II toxin-antitoxin system RelE/ParE family toxin [Rhodopseudomonas rhenobacensis]MBB5047693.1 plasmid stabilization system protein ParE [Rhodopseudomonas rhenobacensis]
MNVRWSKTALVELDEIFRYIAKRNRRAASSVVRRIEALTERLEQFPYSGRLTNETGARVVSVVRYPFVIFYAIDIPADEVVILHIRHTAQATALD